MKKNILALSLFILGWTAPLSAEVMTYQGRLKESNVPVNANRSFLFELCATETPTGCVASADGAKPFAVQNGLFKSTFTLPAVDLSAGPWYLRVKVEGSYLSPVERLTFVPYSVFAATASYAVSASSLAAPSGLGVISSTHVIVLGGLNASDAGVQLSTVAVIEGYAVLKNINAGIEDVRVGVSGRVNSDSTDAMDILAGGNFEVEVPVTRNGSMIGVRAALRNQGSSSLAVGLLVDSLNNTGTIGDTYGVWIATLTGGGQTNKPFAIFSEDPNARSYFAGNVGISSRTPAYALSVSSASGDLFWVAADGAHGLKFWGDGSGLTGVTGASGTDSTKLLKAGDTMTGSLLMDTGSTITVTGSDFSVGGSTFVVKNGYVGIGTASPANPLQVLTASQYVFAANSTSADATINLVHSPGGVARLNDNTGNGAVALSVGHVNHLLVNDRGNVGISSATPSYRLVVSSGAGETGVIMAVSTGATNVFSVDGYGVTALKFTGDGSGLTGLSGAAAAGTATNLAGGAQGEIPYQTGVGNTAMLGAGTAGQLLQSGGAGAPSWTSAPAISGGNITGVDPAALSGGSLPGNVIASSISINSVYDSAMVSQKVNRAGDTMTGSLDIQSARLKVIADTSANQYSLAAGTGSVASHLFVSTSGNVGLGITNPDSRMTLPYNGYVGWDANNDGSSYSAHRIGKSITGATPLEFRNDTNPGAAGRQFSFFYVGNELFTILNGGNVGIGQVNPAAMLDVAGAGNFSGSFTTLSSGTFKASGASQFSVETSSGILVQAGRIQAPALQLTNGAAVNYVLTSDAAGNASWVNPVSGALGDGWVGNEITDTADVTLTRSGTGTGVDPYKLALNLSNANTWVAAQTFSGGLTGNLSGAASQNVLKSGDTMTGPLTLVGSTLTVTGDAFSVGGSTLVVNAGKVGVGTLNPGATLDLYGKMSASYLEAHNTGNANKLIFRLSQWSNDGLLELLNASEAYGISLNAASAAPSYIVAGNFGIGTNVPDQKLTVAGNISQTGVLISSGAGNNYFAGNVGVGIANPAGLFQVGGGSLTVLTSGNIGVGTTAPGARLELYNATVNEDTTIKINNQANTGYAASLRLANATNIDWGLNAGGSGRGDYMNSAFSIEENTAGHAGTRFIIKQEGNVGIGTTGPSYRLHVSSGAGEAGTVMAVSTGATNLFWVAGDGAHALKYYGDGSGLTGVSGTDATKLPLAGGSMSGQLTNTSSVTITGNGGGAYGLGVSSNVSLAEVLYSANGNVGIGTAAPGAKLDIHSFNTTSFLEVHNASMGGKKSFRVFQSNNHGLLDVFDTAETIAIRLNADSTSPSYINGGNLGIGTVLPDQKLTVAGNISQTGVLVSSGTGNNYFAGNVGIGTAAASAELEIAKPATGASIRIRMTNGDGSMTLHRGGTSGANGYFGVENTGTSEIFRIRDDGGVGVGVTAPDQKLTVAGNISQTGVLISSGTGRNYFAGDVTAARYQVGGSTVLAVLPGLSSLGVGLDAGPLNTGDGNLFVGIGAGKSNASGFSNSFLGTEAGYTNTTGQANSFVGYYAGRANNFGAGNTFVGNQTGLNNDGSSNSFFGANSGVSNSAGNNNVFIGAQSGALAAGSNNIVIGYNKDTSQPIANDELNIGGVLYGDLSAKTIGISTRVPQAALDIVSTGTVQTQFAQIWRDSNGNIQSSMSATGVMMASKFVGDGSGLINVAANDATKLPLVGGGLTGGLTVTGASITVNSSDGELLRLNSNATYAGVSFWNSTTTQKGVLGYGNTGGIFFPAINGAMAMAGYSGLHLGATVKAALTIDTLDKVGIGTISPLYALDISTANDTDAYVFRAGVNGIVVSTGGAIQTTGLGYGMTAGNGRGRGAVDLQTDRNAGTQVASGEYSVIGGGSGNTVTNSRATVSGGGFNLASGPDSTVGGGTMNQATNTNATVGGGLSNKATIYAAAVGGGAYNTAAANYAVISGGLQNSVDGVNSAIAGGAYNTASGSNTVISGGEYNVAAGTSSVIAGGENNKTANFWSTVGGGYYNTARDIYAAVGGGYNNYAGAMAATIGGGTANNANNSLTTVGGGQGNVIDAMYGTVAGGNTNKILSMAQAGFIGGGDNNISTGAYSTVGGGRVNSSSGAYSAVLGGYGNAAEGAYSAVAGGLTNRASGPNSSVSGGRLNNAWGDASIVAGGDNNSAFGAGSIVAGGSFNSANTTYSAAVGGNYNKAGGMASFVAGGGNNTAGGWGAVAFGASNASMGDYSFAAGYASTSAVNGTFTWADSSSEGAVNNIVDQAMFKAKGGFWVSTGTVYTDPGLFVNSGNRVGIGTSAPAYKLHVTAATGGTIAGLTNSASATDAAVYGWANSGAVAVKGVASTGYAGRFEGKVYIGDATPVGSSKLVVEGTTSDNTASALDATNSAGSSLLFVRNDGNVGIGTLNPASKLTVLDGDITISTTIGSRGIIFQDGSTQFIAAGASQWAASGSDIYNLNAGNVGVGTVSPLVKFHNNGPAILASNVAIDPDTYANSVIAGNITDGGLNMTGIGGKATNAGSTWGIGHNNADLIFAVGDGTNPNTLQTFMQATWKRNLALVPVGGRVGVGLAAATVPDQKLTVIGNISQTGVLISSGAGNNYFEGNVGIGTSNPGAKLHVSGGTTIFEGDVAITTNSAGGGSHLRSIQVTPPGFAASNPGCGTTAPTGSVNGTDMAGTITLNTGTAPGGLCTVTVTFNRGYAIAPKAVLITPMGSNTHTLNASINPVPTISNFVIQANGAVSPTTSYSWSYIVIE